MVPSGKKIYKYFIDYRDDDHKSKPLCIMLPKTSAYLKNYNGVNKWILFLLKIMSYQKYKTVFGIQSGIVLPICNKKFLKTKIRSYGHEATYFHNNEIPKVGSSDTY